MKCAIFYAQNLCSLPRKNFVCFVFSTNLVMYIIVWQNPDVKLKDGTKSIGKKVLIDGQQRITAIPIISFSHCDSEMTRMITMMIVFL